jgi:hypothetical protein
MRLAAVALVAVACVACVSSSSTGPNDPRGGTTASGRRTYLPAALGEVVLGMPFVEFKKVRRIAKMEPTEESERRTVWTETPGPGDLTSVSYSFGAAGDLPLYQVAIEFAPGTDAALKGRDLFGAPNDDKGWTVQTPEGLTLKAFSFDHTLVVGAKVPGTDLE